MGAVEREALLQHKDIVASLTTERLKNRTPLEAEFATRLTVLFELRSDLNRAQIARVWGCEPTWIYHMQAGKLPSITFLAEKICPTFGVQPGFFLDSSESNHPDILRVRSMAAAHEMIKGSLGLGVR